MRVQRRNPLFEKQLHAEVQRILQLLERTRRTRQEARLLIARETHVLRPTTGSRSVGVGRLAPFRPSLPGPRVRPPRA
jgi:hypothetical protein